MEESGGLTLRELWLLICRNVKVLVTCAIAGLVIGAAFAFANVATFVTSPSYTATMSLAVISENTSGGFSYGHSLPGQDDVSAARNMTQTAAYICEGDQVINAAIKKMGMIGVSSTDIAEGLSANAMKDSQVVVLTLKWGDPDEAMEILNAIADVVPGILIDTLKLGNASVIDSPKVEDANGGLGKQLSLVLVSLLAGLFVGIAILVIRDMLHPKVVDPSSVKELFGVDLIGVVPESPEMEKSAKAALDGSLSLPGFTFRESFVTSAHIISHRLRSLAKEAEENGIQQKKSSQPEPRIIYVTSSLEQEGKSTCAAHLAIELSRDWNVLLIDCDLRNPSLSPLFLDKADPLKSVNGVVNHGVEPQDAIVKIAPNLSLLPAVLEEQRLLIDSRVLDLCQQVSRDYDVVLIDTPPVGQVSDAMALNKIAHEALYVVRYDYATHQTIRANLEVLRQAGIDVVGMLVSRVDPKHMGTQQRYARYSGRHYGYGKYSKYGKSSKYGKVYGASKRAAGGKHAK